MNEQLMTRVISELLPNQRVVIRMSSVARGGPGEIVLSPFADELTQVKSLLHQASLLAANSQVEAKQLLATWATVADANLKYQDPRLSAGDLVLSAILAGPADGIAAWSNLKIIEQRTR